VGTGSVWRFLCEEVAGEATLFETSPRGFRVCAEFDIIIAFIRVWILLLWN
jgi:hypothetical protein